MEEELSDRLRAQRVRNRIMEELSILAGGQEELRRMGWEYVQCLLDWFPEAPDLNPATEIMPHEEREQVAGVLGLVWTFGSDAGPGADADRLLALNRANDIAAAAVRALAVLNKRGRFNEDVEEPEPSAGRQPAAG